MVESKVQELEPGAFLKVGYFGKVISAKIQGINSWQKLQGLIHQDQVIARTRYSRQSAPPLRNIYLDGLLCKNVPQCILHATTSTAFRASQSRQDQYREVFASAIEFSSFRENDESIDDAGGCIQVSIDFLTDIEPGHSTPIPGF